MKNKNSYHRSYARNALAAAVATAALGFAGMTQAAAIVTGFQYFGGDAGTLDSVAIDNTDNTIDVAKTFDALGPMTVRITIAHGTSSGGPFAFTETIRNQSTVDWADYHLTVDDSEPGNAAVITNFTGSTMSGFTLDASSDNTHLNFTGALADAGISEAKFMVDFKDPGEGNTYTVDLTQTPTAVPVPMAGYLLGSALVGLGVLKRKRVTA